MSEKLYSHARWHDDPKPITNSQCLRCKRYAKYGKCAAFEGEIPFDILSNKIIHDKPYHGDNGVLFEPKEQEKQGV
jgi:hypothetical protein